MRRMNLNVASSDMNFGRENIGLALKKLLHYCNRYSPLIIISIILAIGSAVLTLIGPQKIMDMTNAIQNGLFGQIDLALISSTAISLVIIYSVSIVLSYLMGLLTTYVTNFVSKKMRGDIVAKVNNVPLKFIDSKETGDILSRLTNDVDTISQALNSSMSSLVTSITLLIGSIIMMFYTNAIMATVAILSSLLGFALMFVIMGKSQKYFIKQQVAIGTLEGHIEEIYTNHSIVRLSNAIEINKKEFDGHNETLRNSNFKAQFLSGLMMPIMGFVGNLGYVAVCISGAILVHDYALGIGIISAFMIYVRLFTNPLSQIAQAMNYMLQAGASSKRVFEFLDEKELKDESKITASITDVKGAVSFDHVHFGYEEDKEIIHDFSITIKPGQKVAIVGPTGAGKTTLVNLLMRFYETTAGVITIDGVNTRDITRENVHSLFGMVLQDTWLFDGTIRENLKFNNPDIDDKVMKDAARVCGVHHFIKALPHGYHTVLNDSLEMSAGQKQLLTITRAMIQNAPMLILDEATSSVDTRTEIVIQNAMDQLTKNRTSFIIAHRLSTIKNADIILVMRDGNIVEQGNHQALLAQNGFYAELYNSQFQEN